jgi:hypothetical protein
MPRPFSGFPPDNGLRDGPAYSLTVALRFPEVPSVARGELSASAIEAARRKVEPSFAIDLTPQRARIVMHGKSLLLPESTELRMRNDVYGAILLEPGETYRVLMPGTMRALFNERRLDVAPLTPAELSLGGEGARRLGYRTRKVDVWTRAAKGAFEIARIQDGGDGGILLCRFLLDWMSAPPSTPLCSDGEVPLHAELRWSPRGAIVFDAVSVLRRLDVPAANLATPPALSRFSTDPLARVPGALFLTPAEVAALRPGAEASKLTLLNATDEVRLAWVDGAPLGWVAPSGRLDVTSFPKAKVSVEWRTFLDDADKLPPQIVTLPGTTETGGSDAGP